MRDMSRADFLNHVDQDYPAFLNEFEQLLGLAPEADRAEAQLLLDHEVALMDFAAAERTGDTDSTRILAAVLGRINPSAAVSQS